jgi:hypothetical protein
MSKRALRIQLAGSVLRPVQEAQSVVTPGLESVARAPGSTVAPAERFAHLTGWREQVRRSTRGDPVRLRAAGTRCTWRRVFTRSVFAT